MITNRAFAEYTRSCAFSMQLSLNQVNALLWIAEVSHIPVRQRQWSGTQIGHTVGTMQSLERKGLCYWKNKGQDISVVEGPYATKAGMLMAELLREAGYGAQAVDKEEAA